MKNGQIRYKFCFGGFLGTRGQYMCYAEAATALQRGTFSIINQGEVKTVTGMLNFCGLEEMGLVVKGIYDVSLED